MMDCVDDEEFLSTIRNEHQYLVLMLRKLRDDLKQRRRKKESILKFDFKGNDGEKMEFTKNY